MVVETTYGLTTALVTADEALHTNWASRRREFDVVRVVDPEPHCRPQLRRAGFAVHPAWVTWIAPAGPSEEAFLDGLSGKERRSVRAGMRFVAEQGIRMKAVVPLDPDTYDTFLELYERQISTMRHGVPFARHDRDDVLAHADEYFAVQALADDTLVGCCVCRVREDVSTVVIRFAATAPDSRQHRVVRAMYMQAFQVARELGCRDISLGTDPALYGHIAKPGLFSFKTALRFTPIPARFFGTMDDPDEATRVLRLDALSEPSLLLRYHLPADDGSGPIAEGTPLGLDVLITEPAPDLVAYQAPFVRDVDVRLVG
ncbi:GNAT family N-acetyltransferase [Streptomyces sp. NPDC001796]|uniref:GNAT family N-acetyltransferase n=1 Tax=Streptomyces sp. NPDC001796 TaxID=3364609 RepID=UPI003675DB66